MVVVSRIMVATDAPQEGRLEITGEDRIRKIPIGSDPIPPPRPPIVIRVHAEHAPAKVILRSDDGAFLAGIVLDAGEHELLIERLRP